MKETFLTRKDEEGVGSFDSIKWAFEEHLKLPDTGIFNAATLYGNDDAPEMIDFFVSAKPLVTDNWFRWVPQKEESE